MRATSVLCLHATRCAMLRRAVLQVVSVGDDGLSIKKVRPKSLKNLIKSGTMAPHLELDSPTASPTAIAASKEALMRRLSRQAVPPALGCLHLLFITTSAAVPVAWELLTSTATHGGRWQGLLCMLLTRLCSQFPKFITPSPPKHPPMQPTP